MKKQINVITKYEDILYLDHPTSLKHPRMSLENRAAQFAPFAALTGHDISIRETARLTDKKIELSPEEKDTLDWKFQIVEDNVGTNTIFTFTYFIADIKKDGGSYIQETGSIKKIDFNSGKITLTNKKELPIQNIIDISGDIFSNYILK